MRIPKFFIPLAVWVIITIFIIAFGISSSIENVENKQSLNIVQSTSIFICPLH